MDSSNWYQTLNRPSWAPPSWLFGPVWSVLYVIIVITFGTVFYKAFTGKIPWIVALPFFLNLIFNFIFTPIQFGLRSNILASVDIVLVILTLLWGFLALWNSAPELRWVVFANSPYLLWGIFASVLQFTITYLNWR